MLAKLPLLFGNQICVLTLQIRPLATSLRVISPFTFACSFSLLLIQHKQPEQSFGAANGMRLGVRNSPAWPHMLECQLCSDC